MIIGSFGPPFGKGGGLASVSVDVDGRMHSVPIRTERPLDSATFLCAVPREDGANLYAVERSSNRVAALRWRRAVPDEAELLDVLDVGEAPCHVAVDPGRGVGVVSAYGDGSLTTFTRQGDGSIHGAVRHVPPLTPAERAVSRAHCAIFAGPYVLSSDLGLDRVNVWHPAADGSLTWLSSAALPAGSAPRHLRVHPSGAVYVVCERSGAIATLAVGDGVAHVTAYVPPSTAGGGDLARAGGASAAELAFSGDGRLAFVGMRADDSIASYVLDGEGLPVWAASSPGGRSPRHHVVIGDMLLVAYQDSDEVASFAISRGSGILRPLSRVTTVSPSCLLPI
ncbi:MAG: lactonase family protein [Microbacterium sp.]|jgi:6-phosphogluconolactonase (cycloisomerase 2 family)|uniref:lactonase family protein n=1 Tax=Microbacterium sp. TaxID=51671 RepID=UPI002610C348|nr:beta-propeller fold lactonase family protein [Microbacterium sp.]MDF2561296.1 lactonase family protein [Microbacterium sp.]